MGRIGAVFREQEFTSPRQIMRQSSTLASLTPLSHACLNQRFFKRLHPKRDLSLPGDFGKAICLSSRMCTLSRMGQGQKMTGSAALSRCSPLPHIWHSLHYESSLDALVMRMFSQVCICHLLFFGVWRWSRQA